MLLNRTVNASEWGNETFHVHQVIRERLLAASEYDGYLSLRDSKIIDFHFVCPLCLETFNHRRFYGMTHSLFYVTCTIRYLAAFETIRRTGDILAKR